MPLLVDAGFIREPLTRRAPSSWAARSASRRSAPPSPARGEAGLAWTTTPRFRTIQDRPASVAQVGLSFASGGIAEGARPGPLVGV